MTPLKTPESELESIEREAHAWVRQLALGKTTPADADALRRWCAVSPDHVAAFALARSLWADLHPAGEISRARSPARDLSAGAMAASAGRGARSWNRRAFLGTAMGASAAAVCAAAIYPPLGLWPSVGEWSADYRTATGEQRRVALAGHVTVDMNTRTSIAVRSEQGDGAIELLEGEAAIDTMGANAPFTVIAQGGRTLARAARFEVRQRVDDVCVTCLQGEVSVRHATGERVLRAQQQVSYDRNALGALVSVDAADLSAWREGVLRFRSTALAKVIDEINRYRPGRVVLLARRVEAKPLTARFQIQHLDKAITQIQESFQLSLTALPGGVLVLS